MCKYSKLIVPHDSQGLLCIYRHVSCNANIAGYDASCTALCTKLSPDIDSSLALNHMLFLRLRSATSRMRRMLSHNATANAFIGSANAAPNTARRD